MRNIHMAGIAVGVMLTLLGLSFATMTYAANSGMDSMMAGNSNQLTGEECPLHEGGEAGTHCCHSEPNDDGVGAEESCHDGLEAGNGHHHDEACEHGQYGGNEHFENGEECQEHLGNDGRGHGMMGHMMGS